MVGIEQNPDFGSQLAKAAQTGRKMVPFRDLATCRCAPLIQVLIKTHRTRAGKTSDPASLELYIPIGLRFAERSTNRFMVILPWSGFRLMTKRSTHQPYVGSA